ncbi:MAG: hypothetical protein VKQ33_06530 [Candidatus Sericytochromatia bacterium]|nr:hypothetical protein [Candidatus Sericytochromatia bacterium]
MICPLMSYAANQVACAREQCAMWDKREETCGVLATGLRIQDSLLDLVNTLNDIKVKF